jgi:hypothetical protein
VVVPEGANKEDLAIIILEGMSGGNSMSAYSATLSDEVMSAARRSFERYDHDNSGTIQVEVFLLHDCCQALDRQRTLTSRILAGYMQSVDRSTTRRV